MAALQGHLGEKRPELGPADPLQDMTELLSQGGFAHDGNRSMVSLSLPSSASFFSPEVCFLVLPQLLGQNSPAGPLLHLTGGQNRAELYLT